MNYEEVASFPEELIGIVDEKITMCLYGKSIWCLKIYEEELEAAIIYSIMPDMTTAVLEYLYGVNENSMPKEHLVESRRRLKDNGINRVYLVIDERKCSEALRASFSKGVENLSASYHYLGYSYKQIRNSNVCANINNLKTNTVGVGNVMNPDAAYAMDVRDILEELSVFTIAHEQYTGIGKYYVDDNKILNGVLLGRVENTGDFYITVYYDNNKRNNAVIFSKLLLSIVIDYLECASSEKNIEIVCQNEMIEAVVRGYFGEELYSGKLLYRSVKL